MGAAYLVTGARSFSITDPKMELAIFVPLAALFFSSYYLSGVQEWGRLFHACIFTGMSVMMIIVIITDGVVGPVITVPNFLGVAASCFVTYFLDRSRWWVLIPGYIIVVLTVLIAIPERISVELLTTFLMLAAALQLLVFYLLDRSR